MVHNPIEKYYPVAEGGQYPAHYAPVANRAASNESAFGSQSALEPGICKPIPLSLSDYDCTTSSLSGLGCSNCSANCMNRAQTTKSSGVASLSSQLATPQNQKLMLTNGDVVHYPLNYKDLDAIQILKHLSYFADQFGRHPEVRKLAIEIINGSLNHDVLVNVRKLTEFVREQMIFVNDPTGSEFVTSPLYIINQIRSGKKVYGDCDDHALFLNTLLRSVGINTQFAGIPINGNDIYDHVIVRANIGGKWVDIDPTVKTGYQPIFNRKLIV